MGTTTSAVSTSSIAAVVAAAAGGRADEGMANDAFAQLLQTVAAGFQNSANPLDAMLTPANPLPPEPKPTDIHDNNANNDNNNAANAATKPQDSNKSNSGDQNSNNSTTSANTGSTNATSDAQAQIDASQAVQLAALQVQLMASTATPTVQATQVAAAVQQTAAALPTADGVSVDPNAQAAAQLATPGPTNPVAQLIAALTAAPQAAQTTSTPITPTQQLASQQTATTTAPTLTPVMTVSKPDAANTNQVQTQVQDQAATAPQTSQVATTTTPQTPEAKAQSAALTQLLGTSNQIQVNVTVANQAPATPSLNPYDHYVGYTMAANAGASLANGGAGEATTNLFGDQQSAAEATAAPNPAAIALSALTAAPALVSTPNTPSAMPVSAPLQTGAIAGIAETQSADGAQADGNQAGLGQSQGGTNGTNGTNQANATNATQATKPTVTPSQIFDQVKVQITRATKAGLDQVSIQLRPENLGRVDVKLDVTADGKVHAHVIADKPETLQLMQSDARGLEKALNDAGLRTDSNALDFSLRGDSGSQAGNNAQGSTDGATSDSSADAGSDQPAAYDYSQAAASRGGVDTYV